jgi:eukaryotic-like serine/threonine-protein kinase
MPRLGAQPGDIIDDRYEIQRVVGRGAMADVFQARDRQADREVALKILRRTLAQSGEPVRRFEREAHVQRMISHRNVAAFYDVGVTRRGNPFLVVELLRGRSLKDVLGDSGRVGVVHAASYAWQTLQGLAAVHAAGILHRDLKPANIMLEPSAGPVERVVLIDFGFASLEGASKLTAAGHVVGSLSYMAPERLRGEVGDARADVYGLGVVLYELLVGRRPFVGADDMELVQLHLHELPEPPRAAAPDAAIPPRLEAIVLCALAKDPAARPKSAAAMAELLEDATQDAG